MSARLGLLAQLSLRMDAIPAHQLIKEHRAEVLREAADKLDAHCEKYGVLGVGDRLRRMADAAGQGEPDMPTCTHCRQQTGPWQPTGDRYPSGAQVLECVGGCKQAGKKDTREGESTPPTAELTIYRASHDSIVMDHYTTREAAREHCETLMHREQPDADLNWYTDPTEGYEDAPEDLFMVIAGGESDTGYAVTALEVASEYDAEADE